MNSLFSTYQKELVKLSNLSYGRKLLGIDEKEGWIVGLTPNSYIIRIGRNRYQQNFRCYNLFSKKIGATLTKIDISRNDKLYSNLDKYQGLLHYAGLFEKPTLFPRIFLATSFYSGAGDGYCTKAGNVTDWATQRNAATATTADYTGSELVLESIFNNPYYVISRSFLPFNTASLGSLVTITAASIFLYKNWVDGTDSNGTKVVAGTQANTDSVVVDDYNNIGTTSFSAVASASINTGSYTEFALSAGGIANISKTDWSKFALRDYRDFDNSAPTVINRMRFEPSEETGTSKDPYLSITYTKPGGGLFFAQY